MDGGRVLAGYDGAALAVALRRAEPPVPQAKITLRPRGPLQMVAEARV